MLDVRKNVRPLHSICPKDLCRTRSESETRVKHALHSYVVEYEIVHDRAVHISFKQGAVCIYVSLIDSSLTRVQANSTVSRKESTGSI